MLIVQRAEDVTGHVQQHRPDLGTEDTRQIAWQQRFADLESDLFARAQDLAAAVEAREPAARRLAALADLALRLSAAGSVADVGRVMTRDRLALLGADGMSVVVPEAGGGWALALDTAAAGGIHLGAVLLPGSSPLPAAAVARSGRRLMLLSRQASVAFHPGMAEVQRTTGMNAWAFLPLRSRGKSLGCLTVCWLLVLRVL